LKNNKELLNARARSRRAAARPARCIRRCADRIAVGDEIVITRMDSKQAAPIAPAFALQEADQ